MADQAIPAEQLGVATEKRSEMEQSLVRIAQLLLVCRYLFVFAGVAFLGWEVAEVLWVDRGMTLFAAVEIAVVGVLGAALAWVVSSWGVRLARQAGQTQEELVAAYQTSQHEITERMRVEQELRESEERFRGLYENAPLAYYSVGIDGRIHMVNRSAEELLGFARDRLIGSPFLELYADTPAGKERAQILDREIRDGKEVSGEEQEMRRADGTSVWVNLTVRLIRDANGQLLERRCIMEDITERRRAEEALRESELRVRELAAATVRAHEEERQRSALEVHDRIAQPLGAAFYRLQMLEHITAADAQVREVTRGALELLKEAIHESRNVMNDLYPAGLEEFGVVPLIEAELSRLEQDIGCRVAFYASSPATLSTNVGVTLYRIFHEALSNIRQHATTAANVNVSLGCTDGVASIEVRDDGPGFDVEATEENRVSGLMIMRRRAEMVGGTFELTSVPGKGTVVTVRVPRDGDPFFDAI